MKDKHGQTLRLPRLSSSSCPPAAPSTGERTPGSPALFLGGILGRSHVLFQTSSGCSFPNPRSITGKGKLKKRIFGRAKCLKTGFSDGFVAGSYRDTSLSSLKRERLRLKRDEKRATEQLAHFADLRTKTEETQRFIREERKRRRLERKEQFAAAKAIQKHMRRYLTQKHIREQHELLRKQEHAATLFQSMVRMRQSRVLAQHRRVAWTQAATRIQRQIRSFLDIRHAKAELALRRESRAVQRAAAKRAYLDKHAMTIQRRCRGILARQSTDQKRKELVRCKEEEKQRLQDRRKEAMKKADRAARKDAQKKKNRKVPRYMRKAG